MKGRTIRIYLVDGVPTGILTAEIINWTGKVFVAPRSQLANLAKREEAKRTGVYCLVGQDPDSPTKDQVYIGEGDSVLARLTSHDTDESKDFWSRAVFVISKDQNLTKAHVKVLESLLIQQAQRVGRCTLLNGTRNDYIGLPEADQADMAFFLDQIRTVLPVLGFEFLRDASRPPSRDAVVGAVGSGSQIPESPRFRLTLPKHAITAYGQEVEGEFFVLKGSHARGEWAARGHHYERLHQQLCEEGVLVEDEKGLLRFSRDYAFSSPSAAAAMVVGRAANGRTEWKREGSGQTYAEWQEQVVDAAAKGTEAGG